MEMILRWFQHGDDSVTVQQIRQVLGVSGVAAVEDVKNEVTAVGLEMEVIQFF